MEFITRRKEASSSEPVNEEMVKGGKRHSNSVKSEAVSDCITAFNCQVGYT